MAHRAFALVLLLWAAQCRAFFRMMCSQPVTLARADPITSIDKVSTHYHQVLGSNGFDFSVDYDALRDSSCSTCQAKADKSIYWTPTLWFHAKNGSFHRVSQLGGGTVYYLQRTANPGDRLTAFPKGFRMLAGEMTLRSFNASNLEQRAATHHCLDYAGSGAEGEWNYLPMHNCPDGVRTQIFFPSCWDGVNLDSSDHKSHMAYPDEVDSGTCPTSHPVRLISIFYEIIWDTNAWKDLWWTPSGTNQPFVLSTGDSTGYSFHGDFYNGWDVEVLQKAVDQCTDLSGNISDCGVLELQTDDEMNGCVIPPRTYDDTEGWVSKLPGCNSITNGPAAATVATSCNANTTIISRPKATFLTILSNWTSVGCARDDLPERALPVRWAENAMTVDKCVAYCSSSGYVYAGLEYSTECWCGSKFDSSRLGDYACEMDCGGNGSQRCGGSSLLAVYRKGAPASANTQPSTSPSSSYIKPTDPDHSIANPGRSGWYAVGCFKDTVSPRTLRGNSLLNQVHMTPKVCADHCAGLGYNYAGVEYGKECHCGNELYGSSKISDSSCNMKCSGDSSKTCGGSSALAVFRKSSKASRADHARNRRSHLYHS